MMEFSTYNSMFLLTFLVTGYSFSSMPQKPLCNSGERSALLQFKESFAISKDASADPLAYPKFNSWDLEKDCCSWDGVECDDINGHVIGLNLSSSCLFGSINSNSTLFLLLHLQKLALAYNHFNYSLIPSRIGNLSMLTYLDLSFSSFSGPIPSEIFFLSKLSYLDLRDNSFTGQILSSLANLTNLTYLYLDMNNFSGSGTLSWLDKLTKLSGLSIEMLNLNGSIPSSLANLTQLTLLDLSGNQFSGEIPSFLANLTQLTYLNLASNKLTGQLPYWLGNLTQLNYLNLALNNFSGSIPSAIFGLRNLEYFNLKSNHLNGTVALDEIVLLKNLTALHLSLNNLVLLLNKTRISTLPKLAGLGLAACKLDIFPDFLRQQDSLHLLDLSFNNLQGKIPSWMWRMSTNTLEYMDLSHNFLTGLDQPPISLPWTNLRVLNLSSNNLQGSVPIPPSSISLYLVSNNSLTGEIPPLICSLGSLQVLDLSNNNLNGTIPPCLINSSDSLSVFNLKGNSLHGTIPETWASKLRMIDLGQNNLQGKIPTSIAKCRMLESLDLGNNQLQDTFPSWLGALPELKILILRSNKIHGSMMGSCSSDFNFSKLKILDLSSNELSGKLPSDCFLHWNAMRVLDLEDSGYLQANTSVGIGGFPIPGYYDYSIMIINKGMEMEYRKVMAIFKALDLSSNRFEGEIPELIGNLQGLQLLNLSINSLSGRIPLCISNLTQLESLDLSQNNLSGEIPSQLTRLTFLAIFYVSQNHLTGRIPQGNQFDTFQNYSYEGNLGLCGIPLSKGCENVEDVAPHLQEDQGSESQFHFDWKIILMGYFFGFLVGVIIEKILSKAKHDLVLKVMRWIQQKTYR